MSSIILEKLEIIFQGLQLQRGEEDFINSSY